MSATETSPAVDERPRFEGAWERKRLADLLSRPPRYGINAPAVPDDGNLPTYIRITDISDDGRYCPAPRVAVQHRSSSEYFLDPGDLVVARTGASVGKAYTCRRKDIPLVFAGFLIQLRPNSGQLEPWYLDAHVRTASYWSWVKESSARTGQPGINAQQLSQYEFSLPAPPEQRAIAAALSDVDDLLQSLDRLIAKKRDVKQGAMQQLLTGTTRLPGFEGPWETKRLGELLSACSSGATPSRAVPQFFQGDVPWVNSGDLNYTAIDETSEQITKRAVSRTNLKIHPPGTFLIAITGLEAAGTRGSCGILGIHATTNQSCMALIPTKEVRSDYLFHWYVLNGDALAFQYCQGTKQQSYTAGIIKNIPILMPVDVDEQRAISTVLSNMDAEIDALEARRDKVTSIKQGMMQELLTGRTRLPIPEEATDA